MRRSNEPHRVRSYRLAKEEVGHCTEQRDGVDQRTENDSQIADELNILDAADDAFDFRFDMSITGVTRSQREAGSRTIDERECQRTRLRRPS